MESKKNISNGLFRVDLAEQTQPNFIAQKNKEWVLYGDNNDYTKYLIDLFNRNAEHNAIISGKTNYIAGKGLYVDDVEDIEEAAKLEKFLSYANRYQDWNEILKKITLDFELFNGYALQCVYGKGGKIVDVYHLEFSKVRLSKCGKKAFYCNDWSVRQPETTEAFKTFDLYNDEQKTGSSILYYKVNRPTSVPYGDIYPIPDYVGCTADIETDINITAFHFSNAANGMTAQALLTFFNGEPTDEDKRMIKKLFEKNHTGPNKAGSVIFNFVDENQKGAELTNLSASDLDKQFEVLSKRLLQKIFTGHKVTNPILFGIMQEGKLGSRQELIEAWEHFTKTYIDIRRPHVLNTVQFFAKKQGLQYEYIEIEELEPIGLEVPLSDAEVAASLSFDEKRQLIAKKYGIELTAIEDDRDRRLPLASKLGVGGTSSLLQVVQLPIPAQQKVSILTGVFGVSLKKAWEITGMTQAQGQPTTAPTQMSEQEDPVLVALLSCGKDDNQDEVVEERFIDFDSNEGAMKFEANQKLKFADVISGDVKTIRQAILDLLAGDPSIKPELIAKQLGLDVEYINEQIGYLIDKGIILEDTAGFTPTSKGLDKAEEAPIAETEIYTVYKYAERNGVPDAKESRTFCKKLLASGKTWERSDIEDKSNQFGTNVWLYRGGWYTNPDTKETTPYCRHIWKAVTKKRKK